MSRQYQAGDSYINETDTRQYQVGDVYLAETVSASVVTQDGAASLSLSINSSASGAFVAVGVSGPVLVLTLSPTYLGDLIDGIFTAQIIINCSDSGTLWLSARANPALVWTTISIGMAHFGGLCDGPLVLSSAITGQLLVGNTTSLQLTLSGVFSANFLGGGLGPIALHLNNSSLGRILLRGTSQSIINLSNAHSGFSLLGGGPTDFFLILNHLAFGTALKGGVNSSQMDLLGITIAHLLGSGRSLPTLTLDETAEGNVFLGGQGPITLHLNNSGLGRLLSGGEGSISLSWGHSGSGNFTAGGLNTSTIPLMIVGAGGKILSGGGLGNLALNSTLTPGVYRGGQVAPTLTWAQIVNGMFLGGGLNSSDILLSSIPGGTLRLSGGSSPSLILTLDGALSIVEVLAYITVYLDQILTQQNAKTLRVTTQKDLQVYSLIELAKNFTLR